MIGGRFPADILRDPRKITHGNKMNNDYILNIEYGLEAFTINRKTVIHEIARCESYQINSLIIHNHDESDTIIHSEAMFNYKSCRRSANKSEWFVSTVIR